MKPLLTNLTLILLTTACSVPSINRPTHESCSVVAPYSGPALRAPVTGSEGWLTHVSASGLTTDERAALAAEFLRAREATGAPSMTVAVWQEGGAPWLADHGTPDGNLHYWASVGKIITAAAILRLEVDEQLSLDDPISLYVDEVPNGNIITLRMLMTHTSGLFSASEDQQVRASGEPLDLENVLDVIRRQPPYACPGQAWRYSNSGYILLGAVIEKVTGQDYGTAASELVISRSAAQGIRLLAPGDALDGIVLPVRVPNEPQMDPRGPQAAGGAVGDAQNMALFLRDLLAGRILPQHTVSELMSQLYPMQQDGVWYGLGLMVYDVPKPDGTQLWVGHSGGAPGARAVLVYAPAQDAIVAVALTGEGSAEATANLMLNALE